MTDYIDALTHSEHDLVRGTGEKNALGIEVLNCMVAPARFSSSQEVEDAELAYVAGGCAELPIPFFSDDGTLEPFNRNDLAAFAAMGISPEEIEILMLEEYLK